MAREMMLFSPTLLNVNREMLLECQLKVGVFFIDQCIIYIVVMTLGEEPGTGVTALTVPPKIKVSD